MRSPARGISLDGTVHTVSGWIVLVALLAVGAAAMSAVPAQLPAASVAGSWVLDRYLSDHPEQVARALRLATGEARVEDARGQPVERGGRGGDVGGRSGEERSRVGLPGLEPPGMPRGLSSKPLSDADRKLLTDLVEIVRFPPPRLTISQAESSVTFAGTGAPRVMRTDGKAEKHPLTAGSIDRRAIWEGSSLVVRYDVGHAGTLVYTYGRAPTTGQLVVRINFEREPGEPGPFEIRFVYNPAPPDGTADLAR